MIFLVRFDEHFNDAITHFFSFMATSSGVGCPQICPPTDGGFYCPIAQSEDCLFLSVTALTEPPKNGKGYPVFFWIHGGSFVSGYGDAQLYDMTQFALDGVVAVAINYRLGGESMRERERFDFDHAQKSLSFWQCWDRWHWTIAWMETTAFSTSNSQ